MPQSIIAGSIIECQYSYKVDGQLCVNVFHYRARSAEPLFENDAANLLTDFDLKVAAIIAQAQSADITNGMLRIQPVFPTRYVYLEFPEPNGGGGAAGMSVSGTSVVVRRRTDFASRSSRGRIYIGGIPKTSILASQVTAAFIAANAAGLQNAMTASLVGGFGNTYDPVIWSYADKTHNEIIVSGNLDPIIRYQRRREIGKGV